MAQKEKKKNKRTKQCLPIAGKRKKKGKGKSTRKAYQKDEKEGKRGTKKV